MMFPLEPAGDGETVVLTQADTVSAEPDTLIGTSIHCVVPLSASDVFNTPGVVVGLPTNVPVCPLPDTSVTWVPEIVPASKDHCAAKAAGGGVAPDRNSIILPHCAKAGAMRNASTKATSDIL